MKVKLNITSDKKLLDERIEALMLDLEKAYDEISQLKRANDSKSGKIQEKLVMLKDDFSNKNKIQTAVTDFMEHQVNLMKLTRMIRCTCTS